MQEETTLYNIVCQECNQPYDFRVYQGSRLVTEYGIKPDVDQLKALTSHGICEVCLPKVYARYGIELEAIND